jgi:hypothetical protein
LEDRARTPNELAGPFGREKKARLHISESILAGLWCGRRCGQRLPIDRSNPPNDEVPILAYTDGNYWLNVQYVLCALARLNTKVGIVLEQYADEAGNWVLSLLSQLVSGHNV